MKGSGRRLIPNLYGSVEGPRMLRSAFTSYTTVRGFLEAQESKRA